MHKLRRYHPTSSRLITTTAIAAICWLDFGFIHARAHPAANASTPALANTSGQSAERIAIAGKPVAAKFDARDNHSLHSIQVDGVNLLQGSGFHIIGSVGTADDANNVASESVYNSHGVMKAYNNAPAGGQLPYELKFSTDPNDPSLCGFSVSVGKSTTKYAVMNIPLEASAARFTYWRHSAAQQLYRYDQNPFSYEQGANGKYYIEAAVGPSSWGELIGPQYTLRITITKSSVPMELSFVNAPGLGGGIRDVEFGFTGLPPGEKRTASGLIQVFRTDPAMLPATTFRSDDPKFHEVGRKENDGWSVKVADTPNKFLQFGPYVAVAPLGGVAKNSSQLPAGNHIATFRLLIDDNKSDDNRILTIDVRDSISGKSLATSDITRKMFPAANAYRDFSLNFLATPGQRLEFRTFWRGGAYVREQAVNVR